MYFRRNCWQASWYRRRGPCSVKQTCQRHVCSVGRSGYAARRPRLVQRYIHLPPNGTDRRAVSKIDTPSSIRLKTGGIRGCPPNAFFAPFWALKKGPAPERGISPKQSTAPSAPHFGHPRQRQRGERHLPFGVCRPPAAYFLCGEKVGKAPPGDTPGTPFLANA